MIHLVITVGLAFAQADNQKINLSYQDEAFKNAASQIIVVTLDEQTDEAFGEFYKSGKHLQKLAELHPRLAEAKARAIAYDISSTYPPSPTLEESRQVFLKSINSSELPSSVAYVSQQDLIAITKQITEEVNFDLGYCAVFPDSKEASSQDVVYDFVNFELGDGNALLIEQAFATNRNFQPNSVKMNLRIQAPNDESFVEKKSLQEIISLSSEELRTLVENRYIFVGADYEKIDVPPQSDGTKVNGVFFHAAALAAMLANAAAIESGQIAEIELLRTPQK